MTKRILIDALHPEETRVVIADENQIYDFDFVSAAKKQLKGNIYLAKITRVEPSLQAAFVEYGGGKQGFLPFAEIHADYYQIPMSDRQRLMAEAAAEEEDEEKLQETAPPASEVSPVTETPAEGEAATPVAETPELPEMTSQEGEERPAYLMQGAIELPSVSEAVAPPAEQPMEEPFVESQQALAQTSEEEHAGATDGATNEEVETIPSEEEEYRPKKNHYSRRYKIQEVIRRGQIVLVQVIKEERGNKGVSLTTYLSLAGRYVVLMPNSPKDGGISRKIASADDRKRLKAISTELKLAAGMSVIIRTAGMDRARTEIKRDYDYLVNLWNQIREDTLKSTAPALIYEESDIIKRAIRDQYTSDIDEIVIEGDDGYKSAKDFMKLLLASHAARIKHYNEPTPLFYAYNIEEQLLSMHDPAVKLRSGGYIVMNPTEALISIDVNSGRATGERNIEETAVKTNIEAAVEVARQLRLRDLAGLIVIDFIDMLESRNRRAVEKTLKDALKADRAKIQIGRISPFGLLEMSRQRLRSSISETNMTQCPHCVGRGVIRSNESMSIQMVRAIEKEASAGVWSGLRLIAPQAVALHLLNHKRDILRAIELRYSISVQVLINPDLTASEFNLEKMRKSQGERDEPRRERSDRDRGGRDRNRDRPERAPRPSVEAESAVEEAGNDNADLQEGTETAPRDHNAARPDGERRPRGRRGRRGGRGNREDRPRLVSDNVNPEAAPAMDGALAESVATSGADGEPAGAPRPRRERGERGGRGRRRWRDRDERENAGAPRQEGNQSYGERPLPAEGMPIASQVSVMPTLVHEAPAVIVTPPLARRPEPVAAPVASTPRDPSAPPKKGWWKKMIDLDD